MNILGNDVKVQNHFEIVQMEEIPERHSVASLHFQGVTYVIVYL